VRRVPAALSFFFSFFNVDGRSGRRPRSRARFEGSVSSFEVRGSEVRRVAKCLRQHSIAVLHSSNVELAAERKRTNVMGMK